MENNDKVIELMLKVDTPLYSTRTSALLFEYLSDEAKLNSFIRPIEISNQLANFGHGSSIDQIMPVVETFTGNEKFTGSPIFVKKFKDFKLLK